MAKVLSGAHGRFWPVDKVILAYLAMTSVLILAYWGRLPEAPELIAIHVTTALLIVLASKRVDRLSWIFRHWYPLPLVFYCYREMALIIPAVRSTSSDQWLAGLDFSIWHVNPTVWLERVVQNPPLTLFLEIVYTLFVPAVLLIPTLLWAKRRYADFRYCAFLIAAGFLISYVGYIFVPARGPRFLLDHLQQGPLDGGWLFHSMRSTLDRLESPHYDCFPSGHTELSLIAWWSSRRISNQLFWVYLAYTVSIIFATVYLRYHYTVDLMAAGVVAAVLLATAPAVYRKLSGSEDSIGA